MGKDWKTRILNHLKLLHQWCPNPSSSSAAPDSGIMWPCEPSLVYFLALTKSLNWLAANPLGSTIGINHAVTMCRTPFAFLICNQIMLPGSWPQEGSGIARIQCLVISSRRFSLIIPQLLEKKHVCLIEHSRETAKTSKLECQTHSLQQVNPCTPKNHGIRWFVFFHS